MMHRARKTLLALSILALVAWGLGRPTSAFAEDSTKVHYKTVKVGDLDIFYREAGPQDMRRRYYCCMAFRPVRKCFAT